MEKVIIILNGRNQKEDTERIYIGILREELDKCDHDAKVCVQNQYLSCYWGDCAHTLLRESQLIGVMKMNESREYKWRTSSIFYVSNKSARPTAKVLKEEILNKLEKAQECVYPMSIV